MANGPGFFRTGLCPYLLAWGWRGRAWFPIPMEELQREIASGIPRDYAPLTPNGFPQVLAQLEGLIFELTDQYDKIVIGGFSQGAMMASHLAASCGPPLCGALLYSTVLLDQERLQKTIVKETAIPFLQSHGIQDPVLSIQNGRKLFSLLQENGWQGEWFEFRGGHEIPMTVLQKSQKFLSHLVAT